MEIEKKLTEIHEAFHAFKANNEKELKELKERGAVSALTKEEGVKLNDRITGLETELKAAQVALNRTVQEKQAEEQKGKKTAHQIATNSYLRKGDRGLSADEVKNFMSVDSDPDGGLVVSPEMGSEIITHVFESSPIRQLASVQTISTDSLELLEDLDEVGSGWVGEIEARDETNTPQLKMIDIPAHELYAMPKVTQKFLDDASINVESWLAAKIAAKLARDEATAFVTGSGVKKPKGLLSYADGTGFGQVQQVSTVGSGVIAADDLMTFIYSLKGDYRKGAKFLMRRETTPTLRKFKGSDGQYLWAPGMNGNTNSSILGYEIIEAADMPTIAASALPIIFGDIKQAYQIVDRLGIRVLRDNLTTKGFVKFYTTKRVGGGVKNFEAYKILKVLA